jgi:hypothetical protein
VTTIAQDHLRPVTAGVDTHKDIHVVAVLDDLGRLVGTESFPATRWLSTAAALAASARRGQRRRHRRLRLLGCWPGPLPGCTRRARH